MLFDLENDPNELNDLGASTASEHVEICTLMRERIFSWSRQHHARTTKTFDFLEALMV